MFSLSLMDTGKGADFRQLYSHEPSLKMATNFPLQSVLSTCKDHTNEELDTFCYTCKKRVCEKCCQETHLTHKWSRSKKVAREVRQNTRARCDELEEMMHELDMEEEEEEVDIDKIEKLRIKWISAINNTADMLKAKRRAGKSKEKTEERKYLKKMLQFFRKDIHEADDTVAVEMEEEFHIKKEKLFRSNTRERKLVFKEGTFSPDVIQQMFWNVVEDKTQSKVKVTERSHFTHIDDSDYIYRIVPLTSDEALIRRYNDTHIDHVDITGKVIKKLQINTGYFIMMDDDIVGTYFGGKKIQRFSSSGTVSDICSTAPLHPDGICKSRDGGMLVCLYDCYADKITPNSRGEVHHIDSSGRIIRRYDYTEDQKNRLFIQPYRISQNINMDLCVVDTMDKEFRCRLVILTVQSKIKSIYTGQTAMKKQFSSTDVCTDNHGRIIVTDDYNDAVHLLDEDGKFLQYILTEQSPLWGPTSLGLHGDTLWVGCSKGVVRVYKYSDD